MARFFGVRCFTVAGDPYKRRSAPRKVHLETVRPAGRLEFVTQTAKNDFPQLPVIQEPDLMLVLSLRPESGKQKTLVDDPEATEVLELEPTARSGLCRGSPAVTRAAGQLRDEERQEP